MKYCKAWPEACKDVTGLKDQTIDVKVKSELDAPVWPKALVTETVESIANQSVEALLKASFADKPVAKAPEGPIAKPVDKSETRRARKKKMRARWADDPVDQPVLKDRATVETQTVKEVSVAPRRNREYYHDDSMKPVWAAFAVLALLFIVVVGSLMQRVRSLEGLVKQSHHGALMA